MRTENERTDAVRTFITTVAAAFRPRAPRRATFIASQDWRAARAVR
ncbi:hypothetical protein [Microbacterium dextranolyticum]|nr:hypothetical protein [Microbacterium dextranolyticum]MBM7461908.1 hypothetical protein [Microbacterium dextranolyticum]